MEIYTDASAFDKLALGSWAYCVPHFGITKSGILAGAAISRFELAAAVMAIEHVVAVDATQRPIRLHSDSECALAVLRQAANSRTFPPGMCYELLQDLFVRASEALASRRFEALRPERHCPYHRQCHKEAYRALRRYIRGNTQLSQQLEMYRAQHRYHMLLLNRAQLAKRLARMDRALAAYRESGIIPARRRK